MVLPCDLPFVNQQVGCHLFKKAFGFDAAIPKCVKRSILRDDFLSTQSSTRKSFTSAANLERNSVTSNRVTLEIPFFPEERRENCG